MYGANYFDGIQGSDQNDIIEASDVTAEAEDDLLKFMVAMGMTPLRRCRRYIEEGNGDDVLIGGAGDDTLAGGNSSSSRRGRRHN